jgi:alanine dehydrogenase
MQHAIRNTFHASPINPQKEINSMIIGVPKEIKDGEFRVALTPAGVKTLTRAGHQVLVEQGAGWGSAIADGEYEGAGAMLVDTAEEVWGRAELVVKVKEPLPTEYRRLRRGQMLFTYLHLASSLELTRALQSSGIIAIAYETVQTERGTLPLLVPMSEIAGKMAVQAAMQYLERKHGGRGILLGGVPGVPPAEVVIIGCGVVGLNAAKVAVGLNAHVTILDIDHDRLKYLDDILRGSGFTVYSNEYTIERAALYADVLIGAVLVPGAEAPKLVSEEIVKQMKPGSVILDVAVDQGGCVETTHPTSHSAPTYLLHDVIHYAVPNMPGAVPRTSTYALTNATMPYILAIANHGLKAAAEADVALRRGINIAHGEITHPAVASVFHAKCVDPLKMLT